MCAAVLTTGAVKPLSMLPGVQSEAGPQRVAPPGAASCSKALNKLTLSRILAGLLWTGEKTVYGSKWRLGLFGKELALVVLNCWSEESVVGKRWFLYRKRCNGLLLIRAFCSGFDSSRDATRNPRVIRALSSSGFTLSGELETLVLLEKCMGSMQTGTQMVKLRGGSKGLVRFFYLDEHKSCIRWRPSRKNEKAKISVDSIREVCEGKQSEIFQRYADGSFDPNCCFSIYYGEHMESLDLVSSTGEEARTWITGLKYLMAGISDEDSLAKRQRTRDQYPSGWSSLSQWLKQTFAEADKNGDGCLSISEVLQLLHKLNVNLPRQKVKQMFKSFEPFPLKVPVRLCVSQLLSALEASHLLSVCSVCCKRTQMAFSFRHWEPQEVRLSSLLFTLHLLSTEARSISRFKEADTDDNQGTLGFEEFCSFYKMMSTRRDLYLLMLTYSNHKDHLDAEDLKRFLETEQKLLSAAQPECRIQILQLSRMDLYRSRSMFSEMVNVSKEHCQEIVAKFEPCAENQTLGVLGIDVFTLPLSPAGFTNFMRSPAGDIFNPEHYEVNQDMTQPLSNYFIASSHNTYLMGDQLMSQSRADMYSWVLQAGCRCVEGFSRGEFELRVTGMRLDCWDGQDGEPIVHHGYTLTSKILFRDVIETINKHAFVKNQYPVILSMENHCSVPQQKKMAQYLTEVLGEKLDVSSIPTDPSGLLPSPEALKGKILIKQSPNDLRHSWAGDEVCLSTGNQAIDPRGVGEESREKRGEERGFRREMEELLRTMLPSCLMTPITARRQTLLLINPFLSPPPVDPDLILELEAHQTQSGGKKLPSTIDEDAEEGDVSDEDSADEMEDDCKLLNGDLWALLLMERQVQGWTGFGVLVESKAPVDFIQTEFAPVLHLQTSMNRKQAENVAKKKLDNLMKESKIRDREDPDSFTIRALPPSGKQEKSPLKHWSDPSLRAALSGRVQRNPQKSLISALCAELCSSCSLLVGKAEDSTDTGDEASAGGNKRLARTFIGSFSKRKKKTGKVRKTSSFEDTDTDQESSGGVSKTPVHHSRYRTRQTVETEQINFVEALLSIMYLQGQETLSSCRPLLSDGDLAHSDSLTLQKKKTMKLSRALSDLVYMKSVGMPDFESQGVTWQVSSMSETKAHQLIQQKPVPFMRFNQKQLSRVYPSPYRVDSSNFNPQPFWNAGCHLGTTQQHHSVAIALNYQSEGRVLQLNRAKFYCNGNCGYLQKPSGLCEGESRLSGAAHRVTGICWSSLKGRSLTAATVADHCSPLHHRSDRTAPVPSTMTLRSFNPVAEDPLPGRLKKQLILKVISGQQLPKPKDSMLGDRGEIIDPFVEVEIIGLPVDCCKEQTRVVDDNGFNPMWEETLVFTLHMPEVALIRFLVWDHDPIGQDFIGQRTIAVDSMIPGYRHVYLEGMEEASIFVHIAVNDISSKVSASCSSLERIITVETVDELKMDPECTRLSPKAVCKGRTFLGSSFRTQV
ncbi:hypothetical protein DNTS_015410 [Danionella cerebrum]|nr:hypothetical protein DNTS_015410 [Danionella translucida]